MSTGDRPADKGVADTGDVDAAGDIADADQNAAAKGPQAENGDGEANNAQSNDADDNPADDKGSDEAAADTGEGENDEPPATPAAEPDAAGHAGTDDVAGDRRDTGGKDPYAKKSTVNGLIIGLIVTVGAAAFFAGAYVMDADQSDQITQDDLDEAMAKLELKILQQQLAEKQGQQQAEVVTISADDDPVIGDPDAPITIIEFSDFQCPFCERFSTQTLPILQEEYIDKGLVKLVYRDFPIQSIHPNAVVTALAAECAHEQDGFKGMHDKLFEKQGEWKSVTAQDIVGVLTGYASDIGIDSDEFETCLVMGRHVDDIRGDLEDGRAYGVSGTPGFFVGNDQIGYVSMQGAQPFDSFKRVIDAQLGMTG